MQPAALFVLFRTDHKEYSGIPWRRCSLIGRFKKSGWDTWQWNQTESEVSIFVRPVSKWANVVHLHHCASDSSSFKADFHAYVVSSHIKKFIKHLVHIQCSRGVSPAISECIFSSVISHFCFPQWNGLPLPSEQLLKLFQPLRLTLNSASSGLWYSSELSLSVQHPTSLHGKVEIWRIPAFDAAAVRH